MNAKELIRAVAEESGLSDQVVRRTLRMLGGHIQRELDAGTAVFVPGLGTFRGVERPARVRQTESGETQNVPARTIVKFRPAKRGGAGRAAREDGGEDEVPSS